MSVRRAVWADDQSITHCTKCRLEFKFNILKHHCRLCGLVFCNQCSKNKAIVPQDELVARPKNWVWNKLPTELVLSDEDNFRCPQRLCDHCFYQLRDLQPQLRQTVSRYAKSVVIFCGIILKIRCFCSGQTKKRW